MLVHTGTKHAFLRLSVRSEKSKVHLCVIIRRLDVTKGQSHRLESGHFSRTRTSTKTNFEHFLVALWIQRSAFTERSSTVYGTALQTKRRQSSYLCHVNFHQQQRESVFELPLKRHYNFTRMGIQNSNTYHSLETSATESAFTIATSLRNFIISSDRF
jgi:hypothetical protein